MNIQEIEIDKIIPYHNNPRKNLNVDKVASSITEFGFQQPIVVDKNYVVIVGHTRLQAAKKLNYQKVPVFVADLSENKAKAYRIADNRLNEDSSWDYDFLNIEMNILNEGNYDLSQLGFNDEELKNLLANQGDFEPTDIDDQSDIDEASERCETCGQTLPK
jgi:site-specific DNA-methyltransferase (adenine-specific)|tara:strand:+ start:225 stop:707 length:483 start_codon:yes stop_codon:yes gene_type:complete